MPGWDTVKLASVELLRLDASSVCKRSDVLIERLRDLDERLSVLAYWALDVDASFELVLVVDNEKSVSWFNDVSSSHDSPKSEFPRPKIVNSPIDADRFFGSAEKEPQDHSYFPSYLYPRVDGTTQFLPNCLSTIFKAFSGKSLRMSCLLIALASAIFIADLPLPLTEIPLDISSSVASATSP